MIIDFHAHLLPQEIGRDPAAFAAIDPYFGYRVIDTPARKSRHSWVTYEQAVQEMKSNGITQTVIQGWPMMSYESCRKQNEYTLEAMDAYPEQLIGFCTVNPNDGVNALREIERCIAAGMKGIGELDPEGQGFRLDDENFLRICDLCIELDIPISLHASEPVGPYYHGKSAVPLQHYIDLAQKKPLLKIILAHWGGGLPFYELMKGMKKSLANVYYDTAGSTLPCSPKIFKETVNIVGDRKILFGSNYPQVLQSSGEAEPIYAALLETVKGEIKDREVLQNILYHNAARLLGLRPEGGEDRCEA